MAKVAAIVEFAVACGEEDKHAYPVEMAMVQSDSSQCKLYFLVSFTFHLISHINLINPL